MGATPPSPLEAEFERTGKWTGPLSTGIEKALLYGAWRGGEPEEVPKGNPGDPDMAPAPHR